MKVWLFKRLNLGLIFIVVIGFISVSCGKKGPLYLSKEDVPAAAAEPVNKATTDAQPVKKEK